MSAGSDRAMARRKILILPAGQLYNEIIPPSAEAVFASLGEVTRWPADAGRISPERALELVPQHDAVVTGWGAAPKFTTELLDRSPRLKFIGHTAGSIKSFIFPEVFDRGITVAYATSAIADSVGEWALMMILMSLRRGLQFANHVQQGGWGVAGVGYGHELYRKRVGLVGASHTARALIPLLKPFGVEILVYDPYLSDDAAANLGVRRARELDELFTTCDVVSNHAPTTPETSGMIGAQQLALLRDGALFVNTARADAIDYDALVMELVSGRIFGALDVFPKEPLAADSQLRGRDNVILTPHAAGPTVVESRARLGELIAGEMARFFAGEPLRHQITKAMLPSMA